MHVDLDHKVKCSIKVIGSASCILEKMYSLRLVSTSCYPICIGFRSLIKIKVIIKVKVTSKKIASSSMHTKLSYLTILLLSMSAIGHA